MTPDGTPDSPATFLQRAAWIGVLSGRKFTIVENDESRLMSLTLKDDIVLCFQCAGDDQTLGRILDLAVSIADGQEVPLDVIGANFLGLDHYLAVFRRNILRLSTTPFGDPDAAANMQDQSETVWHLQTLADAVHNALRGYLASPNAMRIIFPAVHRAH